jgi:hypothetical protein
MKIREKELYLKNLCPSKLLKLIDQTIFMEKDYFQKFKTAISYKDKVVLTYFNKEGNLEKTNRRTLKLNLDWKVKIKNTI